MKDEDKKFFESWAAATELRGGDTTIDQDNSISLRRIAIALEKIAKIDIIRTGEIVTVPADI